MLIADLVDTEDKNKKVTDLLKVVTENVEKFDQHFCYSFQHKALRVYGVMGREHEDTNAGLPAVFAYAFLIWKMFGNYVVLFPRR